ncbi:MAG: alpha/beta hydrolase family protein [Fimbriiglobus sp.]|jgi:dienelactone hydrolase|nr:alpha/beta hydrolase family protein [Fimbriiglobus sp.]
MLPLAVAVALLAPATNPKPERGTVKFVADDKANGVPERFRLDPHTFDYELTLKHTLSNAGVEVWTLTFPSPVKSAHVENDTVPCELYLPKGAKGRPAAVVLDILDGALVVSRAQALWLAQHDIPALVVQMAYYGPRRPKGSKERLLSTDVEKSVANVCQTVLDVRRAVAWLESRPEVDPKRIGLLGTSLGSFVGGVAAAAEPKVKNVCLLLGGGGLVDAFGKHPEGGPILALLSVVGITPAKLRRLIGPVDPLTYADTLKGKKLLLVGASRDDVVPPAAMKALWEATGRPSILWVDATHVGAALHILPMMREVVKTLGD